MRKLIGLLFDLIAAGLILLGVWVINYKMPQQGVKAVDMKTVLADTQRNLPYLSKADNELFQKNSEAENTQDAGEEQIEQVSLNERTNIVLDTQDWHQKFADKFTDTVQTTADSYTSPDLSIRLTKNQYDSKTLDYSENGKHKQYGSNVSYVLADIYVGDITCLQTAFAQDTYGIGYSEKLSGMSQRMKSILSVNGDSYSNNRHKNNGTIIRNGVIYRNEQTDAETCVLNWDGTMDIYKPNQVDKNLLVKKGAYQSWIFGPSLLNDDGTAKTDFMTWNYIKESHPRTAIGYYEPGHYCLLLVDGRQDTSRGMFLDEMAKVFEKLGCKKAYNLDGGHCSFMMFEGNTANHPYKPEHEIPDGVFLVDSMEAQKIG